MKIFSSKKRVAAIGVVTAATLVGGGVAFAYFTSTGTGIGEATAGTSTAWDVDVDPLDDTPALLPDPAVGLPGHIQYRDYTVTNLGAGAQGLTQVLVSVDPPSPAPAWSWQPNPLKDPCTSADFSIGGKPRGVPHVDTTLAGTFGPTGSTTDSDTATVAVQMIDSGLDQDNCKNAPVPLYFSAS